MSAVFTNIDSTYYDYLGLPQEADLKDIQKAYRQRALVPHPDKGGNTTWQRKLNEAYTLLKDPVQRKAYDLKLELMAEIDSLSEASNNAFAASLKEKSSLKRFRTSHADLSENYREHPLAHASFVFESVEIKADYQETITKTIQERKTRLQECEVERTVQQHAGVTNQQSLFVQLSITVFWFIVFSDAVSLFYE